MGLEWGRGFSKDIQRQAESFDERKRSSESSRKHKHLAPRTKDHDAQHSEFIRVDSTTNTVTITLPTAVRAAGEFVTVKYIKGGFAPTVKARTGDTIDGYTEIGFFALNETLRFESDGENWNIW